MQTSLKRPRMQDDGVDSTADGPDNGGRCGVQGGHGADCTNGGGVQGRPSLTAAASNLGFLNEFIHLACAPTLLAMHMYPDCKEITESMAAWCVEATFSFAWGPADTGVQ